MGCGRRTNSLRLHNFFNIKVCDELSGGKRPLIKNSLSLFISTSTLGIPSIEIKKPNFVHVSIYIYVKTLCIPSIEIKRRSRYMSLKELMCFCVHVKAGPPVSLFQYILE